MEPLYCGHCMLKKCIIIVVIDCTDCFNIPGTLESILIKKKCLTCKCPDSKGSIVFTILKLLSHYTNLDRQWMMLVSF